VNEFTEKKINSDIKYRGRIINVRLDEVSLPSGQGSYRELVEHPGAVAVLGQESSGRLVFVQQYRYPAGRVMLEVPAGKLEPGEPPEECARREMEEETGYRLGKMDLLTRIYTTPGFCNEVIYVFRSYELEYVGVPTGAQEAEGEEFLKTVLLSREEAFEKTKNGAIIDAKTIIALLWP